MGYIRDRWRDPSRAGKGHRWQVKYRVDGRELDGGSYDVKAVAKRKLTELEASVQRGQWVDPTDRTTVVEYARRWAERRPHRPTTARRVGIQIRNLERDPIGSKRLAAVKPSDVQAWVSTMVAAGRAASTVRLQVRFLGSVYQSAVLDRLVATSPVVRIALPKADAARIVPLTVDQVRELANAIGPRYRAMVLTQAGLGLRIGELLALRVQDVDFLRRTARVEHQIAPVSRERVEPKTPRSRRTIPLPTMVGDALAAHIATYPPPADGPIFSTKAGAPYDHAFYGGRVFARTVKELAGAEGSTFPASTTTHDLRHHYASVLLAAGESVVAVSERLGHDNATLVLTTYGHLLPDSEERTRKAIDAAWNDAPTETPAAQPLPGRS
ncbi:tyrosine-type recombinase/integrase [Pseudonocardia dioxanivorans]|uniref:tyrosine-type recombinase/integrase n=1 Tax=Pseudonocardia dioxanivorans TaxID=240495 RepID=UPI000CD2D43C|nr:site-specific integrase [Pseudonocardia dioxanivorans]